MRKKVLCDRCQKKVPETKAAEVMTEVTTRVFCMACLHEAYTNLMNIKNKTNEGMSLMMKIKELLKKKGEL